MPRAPFDGPILRELTLLRDQVTDWGSYPFSIPAIAALHSISLDLPVTFLVGENGSGKSTLIEAIAIKSGFNPEGGTRNFRSANRPSESLLHQQLRLTRSTRREKSGFFLRAETMFNVSTEAEEYESYGWERLHERSHGEAFLWLALERFFPNGLYILDEPEAALSPQRQLAFLRRMHELVTEGSQFVIATHSPILMAYPGARIFMLGADGAVETPWDETEHYTVTREFLNAPERMLRDLFRED